VANKIVSKNIDEYGMFDSSLKRERKLEGLFAQGVTKFNQCHGAGGKFCSGGSGGGGGASAPAAQDGTKLTPEEFSAVKAYSREDYAVLNSRLRNEPFEKMPEKYQEMTKNIDSAFNKQTPLEHDLKVHRGTNYGNVFGSKKPEQIVGASVTDKGYISTTTSVDVAQTFGSTRLNLVIPKGTKVINMAETLGTVSAKQEREILLPRGTKFQVTHVTQTKGGFLGIGKETFIEAKLVQDVQKFNQCHGAGGKFCSGGSGGGGGGSFQKLPEELNQEELSAIESYADTGFKAMNNALRGKEAMTPEIQSKINGMDSAMAKQPLTKNTTVYRGIKSQKFLGGEVSDPKSLIGKTITDPGFMSTSANSQTAASFSIGKGGVLLQIAVNAGTAALNIRDHVFTDQAFEEHEVLIHRNSKMKITRAEKVGEQLRLSAEVIS
jgi:hypothetical protein